MKEYDETVKVSCTYKIKFYDDYYTKKGARIYYKYKIEGRYRSFKCYESFYLSNIYDDRIYSLQEIEEIIESKEKLIEIGKELFMNNYNEYLKTKVKVNSEKQLIAKINKTKKQSFEFHIEK